MCLPPESAPLLLYTKDQNSIDFTLQLVYFCVFFDILLEKARRELYTVGEKRIGLRRLVHLRMYFIVFFLLQSEW